jgi:hypothetical protein
VGPRAQELLYDALTARPATAEVLRPLAIELGFGELERPAEPDAETAQLRA